VTLSPETLLATAPTRTIVVCNACGCDPGDEPATVRGCPEHGVELVEVECLRASALTGRTLVTAADLTTEQIETVAAHIERIAHPTQQENSLLAACDWARFGVDSSRPLVADAFNALFGGTEAA
jgi:hypothetical protein